MASGRSNTRKDRLQQRLKILEEQYRLRIAHYEEESHRIRQEYERHREQIDVRYKTKMDAKVLKCDREEVDDSIPDKQNSIEFTCSLPVQFDGLYLDHHCLSHQMVQSKIPSHYKSAVVDGEELEIITCELDESFHGTEQLALQVAQFCAANFRPSFTSVVQNDEVGGVTDVRLSSQFNSSRSMGPTEILDTTNTKVIQLDLYSKIEILADENVVNSHDSLTKVEKVICETNTRTVTHTETKSKNDYSPIKLPQHHYMQGFSTSYTYNYKGEPKQVVAIPLSAPPTCSSFRNAAVGISHTIDQSSVDFASFNNYSHPQSRKNDTEFDPGGAEYWFCAWIVINSKGIRVNDLRNSHIALTSPDRNTVQSVYADHHNSSFCRDIAIVCLE